MSPRQRLTPVGAIFRSADATIDGAVVAIGIADPRRQVEAASCARGRRVGVPQASPVQEA